MKVIVALVVLFTLLMWDITRNNGAGWRAIARLFLGLMQTLGIQ